MQLVTSTQTTVRLRSPLLPCHLSRKTQRIVALNPPTIHQGMQDTKGDEFTSRMLEAINSMLVKGPRLRVRSMSSSASARPKALRKPKLLASIRVGRSLSIGTSASRKRSAPAWAFAQRLSTPTAQPPRCSGLS